MKEKLITILTGISALIAAGFLCIVPSTVAHAGVVTGDRVEIAEEYSPGNYSSLGEAFGSITLSYTETAANTFSGGYGIIKKNLNGTETIVFYAAFSPNGDGVSANITFNLNYNNASYSGTMTLQQDPANTYYLFCEMPLFYFNDCTKGSVVEYRRDINKKITDIEKAAQGINPDGSVNVTKTVEYSSDGALDGTIMDAMAKTEGVTLFYTYTYEGLIFRSAITSDAATALYSKDTPWYGPCLIADNCPTVLLGAA
jgi:hypothetical protein